ncbi:outer membrane protein assembly factor BamB family protein [Phytomonospora endophytica]|uniref:Outer membrane protein assembly factor BamB n=1 Tax=Phytomonospora endophytica TaxID=714109 RepID=A0A841FE44_9ACTN|nr:PQQ-binding-like beta-propeller repeat protein [Phytomonospora endophytica]MBB6034536.1 outer membrane protein assembly factor BamB [Phytomonospora endophytica]GIG70444.1 hypothetical protein Pen01_67390 [Phytomonospora endophytica]
MPESHIDLDVREPDAETPGRRRPLIFAAVGLLLAGSVACGLARRPPEEPETAHLVEAAPLWTAAVDEALGEPHVASFSEETVLVTAQRGLVAYDRATGAVKWQRRLEELIASPYDGELNRDAAARVATVVGDAVVLDAQWALEAGCSDYLVLDLATGAVRFALKPGDDAQWFQGRVTSGGIVSVDCDRDVCVTSAHDLADGSVRWALTHAAGTQMAWPARYPAWEHHAPGGRIQPDVAAVGDEPSYLLFVDPERTAHVEAVDIATGELAGEWTTDVDTASNYVVVGGAVLDARPGRVRRIDPVDGGELWRIDTFREDSLLSTDGVLLAGGKLLDSAEDGTRTRWIDLADGTAGPAYAAEHPVVLRSGVGVVSDAAGVTGVDLLTGTTLWHTAVRPGPWETFRERDAFADDDTLVLVGRLGAEQRATRWIYTVDLATGHVRGFGGATAVGHDGGQALTSSFPWERPTEYTVRLVEVG